MLLKRSKKPKIESNNYANLAVVLNASMIKSFHGYTVLPLLLSWYFLSMLRFSLTGSRHLVRHCKNRSMESKGSILFASFE